MKFIKDGVYPISEHEIRFTNPNTSFPKDISPDTVIDLGYKPVTEVVPTYNPDIEKATETAPVFQSGVWVQVWVISPKWDLLDDAKKELKDRVSRKRFIIKNSETVIDSLSIIPTDSFYSLLNTLADKSVRKSKTSIKLKIKDDTIVEITKSKLSALRDAVEDYLDTLQDKEFAHYTAIDGLTSIASAQQYDINTGW